MMLCEHRQIKPGISIRVSTRKDKRINQELEESTFSNTVCTYNSNPTLHIDCEIDISKDVLFGRIAEVSILNAEKGRSEFIWSWEDKHTAGIFYDFLYHFHFVDSFDPRLN